MLVFVRHQPKVITAVTPDYKSSLAPLYTLSVPDSFIPDGRNVPKITYSLSAFDFPGNDNFIIGWLIFGVNSCR
jgi:hypothetical protein